MKLVRLLGNLGYGSRRELRLLLRQGAATDAQGRPLGEDDTPRHGDVRFFGEPLDPPAPLALVMNKPRGHSCGRGDPGPLVFDLLPPRFSRRKPALSTVGRLDKDSSGLLLFTDDGQWLHRVIHPKAGCRKTYQVLLDRPLRGDEAALFASGEMMLRAETKRLLPAELECLGEKEARVTLSEGRYHQVRRMFAAAGNHVLELRRIRIGGLELPQDLAEGAWRPLEEEEIRSVLE